jgi:subtilisin family serine protease
LLKNFPMATSMNGFARKRQAKLNVSEASHLRLGSGSRRVDDELSSDRRSDLYSFTLRKSRSFRATLNRLDHDVALTLFDESGARLARSQRQGSQPEKLRDRLNSGTYYIEVSGRGKAPETDYRLRLVTHRARNKNQRSKWTPISPDMTLTGNASTDQAGNSRFTAQNVGKIDGTHAFTDWVGKADTIDYYKFSLGSKSFLSLSLSDLSDDADLALMDRSGTILHESIRPGSRSEFLSKSLDSGRYFIRVTRYSGQTSYTLALDANSVIPPSFDSKVGYGLVDAAAAIASIVTPSLSTSSGAQTFNAQNQGQFWNADLINVPDVWNQGFTGKGITVAVLDSGVDFNHVDLNDNIWINAGEIAGNGIDDDGNGFIDDVRGWDFVGNNNNPMDQNGHGTHVAGIIAAESNNIGVTGIAPNASIMPLRVLDDVGNGTVTDIAKGINYAVANGADVINLSLGGNSPTLLLRNAIRDAVNQGVFVAIAAGNEARNTPAYPAQYARDWGIAVGAVDRGSNFAFFSNQAGSSPLDYVTAPGVGIRSTLPGDRYGDLSGTSMASPHIAGVAALVLNADPTLTPDEVETLLISTTQATA